MKDRTFRSWRFYLGATILLISLEFVLPVPATFGIKERIGTVWAELCAVSGFVMMIFLVLQLLAELAVKLAVRPFGREAAADILKFGISAEMTPPGGPWDVYHLPTLVRSPTFENFENKARWELAHSKTYTDVVAVEKIAGWIAEKDRGARDVSGLP